MVSTENMLLTKLRQLECHFTWGLNYTDLSDAQNRLKNEIELASRDDRKVGWAYGNLAFTKYMQGLLEEARDDLVMAEEHIRKQHGDKCEKQLIVTYGNFAWVYYHKGEHEKSQTYLDKLEGIKKKFPTESPFALHPETYGEKGKAFLTISSQYYEKAKECFKQAMELEPEEIAWNEGYAVALYRTEYNFTSFEVSPASRQLRRVLELDPDNAYIMVLLGLKHADYKKYQKAKELMERAMNLDPDKPYVIQYVAMFYRKIGKVEESIVLLKRALDRTPDSALLHHQLALSYGKKTENNEKEPEDLLGLRIQHLEKAISLKPSFIRAMMQLGHIYEKEKKDNKKAEEIFKKTAEVAKDSKEYQQIAYLNYANLLLNQNISVPTAVTNYKKGLQLQKDTPEWNECARKLEKIANDKISRDPHDGEAFGILGYVNQMRGDTLQAIECYQKALEGDAENVSFNVGYGVVLYRLEELVQNERLRSEKSEAIPQLKKALLLEPNNAEVMVLLALKLQRSEAHKSQKLIEDALKLSPDVPQVMRYVAKYFRTQDSPEAALDVLEKALEQTPNSSFLHHEIGLCYKKQLINMLQPGLGSRAPATLKRAKAKQCIQCFRKAVGLKPSNIHARVNLAEAYSENQQLNEAEKIFTELLQDESLRDPDKQQVHKSYGLFLFYKKKAEDRAVAQFKAAYRMKIQSYNRRQAGKRLEQIAKRWRKNRRAAEASQILAFLRAEDKNSAETEDLSAAFERGMKFK